MPFITPSLRWLLLLAVVLRAAFVMHHAHVGWQLQYDAGYYLILAEHLQHGVYSLFHPLDIPDTTRMPGYPWLIHLLGRSVPAVLAAQVLLSAIKVLLVARLAQAAGCTARTALVAASLMACEPMDILLTGSVLTESLFTTLLLAGTLLLVRGLRSWKAVFVAALCFAAAAWLRSNGLLLALVAVGSAALLIGPDRLKATALVALLVVLLLPWALRNQARTGRFILSDSGPVAAAHFHLPEVLTVAKDPRAALYRQELHERAARSNWEDPAASAAYFGSLRHDVRHTFMAHPLAWTSVHLRKALGILVAPGRGHITTYFGTGSLARTISGVSMLYSAMLVGALLLCLMRWRQLPAGLVLVCLLATAVVLSGGISTMDARFKAPAMPLFIVVVAWALELGRASRLMQRRKAN
jgi:hypothetical protein